MPGRKDEGLALGWAWTGRGVRDNAGRRAGCLGRCGPERPEATGARGSPRKGGGGIMRGETSISGVPNSWEKENQRLPRWQFCSEEPLVETTGQTETVLGELVS